MNKKIISLFTFFYFFLSNISYSYAQKTIIGTKELPLEINFLIESLQNISPEDYDQIHKTVMSIDQYARSMSKEDIFLIGKIEIYKTLLKHYESPIKKPIDGSSISTLRSAIKNSNEKFTKWFLQALLKDCLNLVNNPTYKEYILQKNNNIKIEKPEYRKLGKKSELLQHWVSKIQTNEETVDSLTEALKPKMLEALKNIKDSFYLMSKEATLGQLPSSLKDESELKFFTIKQLAASPSKIPMEKPQAKSVEEILSPITGPLSAEDLPQPSGEKWLEDENTPPELQNLPKPKNDADWLQDF